MRWDRNKRIVFEEREETKDKKEEGFGVGNDKIKVEGTNEAISVKRYTVYKYLSTYISK